MSMTVVKTVTLRTDDTLVNENNQEILVDTIIHSLGALFKVTSSGHNMLLGKLMMILILPIQNIFVG